MALERTFEKREVYVTDDIDGYDEVITFMSWRMDWKDTAAYGNTVSVGLDGFTELDIDNDSLSSFISANNVTDANLESWAVNKIVNFSDIESNQAVLLAEEAAKPAQRLYYDSGHIAR